MIFTSLPVSLFAETGEPNTGNTEKKTMNYDKTPIGKDQINGKLPVKVAKPEDGQTAGNLIKNPDMPELYTLRADYKVQRGDNEIISYQPYIVTVGENASEEEQKKIDKWIDLPELDGYSAPTPRFHVTYDYIKNNAKEKNGEHPYVYNPKPNDIKVRHVFQHLDDIEKYGGEGATKEDVEEVQSGLTGAILNIQALDDDKIPGYEPESNTITTQVPESNAEFEVVFRYNRKHYNLVYDTKEGTPIPSRTVYFEQVIPALADVEIPKKIGAKLVGWKPSKDIEGSINNVNKIYKAGKVIEDNDGNPVLDLKANLKMPASDITFTAVWEDNEKADYAIQFWAEKADHADNASLLEKYDYIGTRVYKQKDTGFRPNLDKEPVKDIVFPDLDQTRLQKIWNNEKFDRDTKLLLDKFYVYNKELTHKENRDPDNANVIKSVSSTGQTVYNIYYDRQVYDLYFTKSNERPEKSFYPEIYKFDEKQGKAVKVGGPGNPYHFKARFNQLMLDWPNDGMQIKGFTSGNNSHGWSPNMDVPWWDYRDTPPYRLSADQFLDFPEYENKGGYTKKIDAGAGKTIEVKDFNTLSFGIEEYNDSMPHHMDFWMDGFKPGETIIRYDLYRSKADTSSLSYGHKYTVVKGFTPYGFTGTDFKQYPTVKTTKVDEDGIYDLNEERAEITPFPDKEYTDIFKFKHKVGELFFIRAFFNDADQYGDPDPDIEGAKGYEKNGYLRYKYTRNKYPLRFNYDPSKIKADSEFGSTNQIETFYNFPLKVLSPNLVDDKTPRKDKEYFKDNPANFLDNPENLKKLGLTDLVYEDSKDDNKLKVKRPDGISDQMVFKGWALDPAGTKLVWENKDEKMPNHPVNLYAKWDEPDSKWKVTFDPNGGELQMIDVNKLTAKTKTIREGDIEQEEVKTYPEKGYKGKELPDEKDPNKEKKPQVFTVIQRQKLLEPKIPKREGYDFMGWEFVRYEKDENGEDTDTVDTSYRDTYKVPELYSFGNDVVSNVHLKAIWVKNNVLDIKAYHHFLDLNFDEKKVVEQRLPNRRAGSYTAAVGSMQGTDYLLISTKDELKKLEDKSESYRNYKELTSTLNPVGRTNTYTQVLRIEPTEIKNPTTGKYEPNPDAKVNVFHFYYRPFRKREYKVKYVDERYMGDENNPEGAIIADEDVVNGNRDYDARNYRAIPGWKLVSAPQQQLFFDVGKDNEFLGINGTGNKYITFYYKDVRVIEVPKDGETPEGYVRITFKADKGGSFGKDAEGKDITELHYDVIEGLKSQLLPVPKELGTKEDGTPNDKEDGKYYITPDNGKKFTKWDNIALLNKDTIINEPYTFTAYFDWEGLSSSGLVRTEAFKDPNGTWTNDFAPKIEDLKKQLVWKEKGEGKPLPEGTIVKFYDESDNELKTDEDVYKLVNEQNKADKDELVRTVNIKAKVTFPDKKAPQELEIPIKVYKNVYEALTGTAKPLFLSEAEKGELKNITGDYVKVTVAPTGDLSSKDNKVYYVNKNAWVEIPELTLTEDEKTKLGFTNWSADIDKQNEDEKQNGIFNFAKRHKFTEDTVISPDFSADVIPGDKEGNKPDGVPTNFVKVTVKTTDKATDETAYEKVFWVNPAKEVVIPVTKPTGKDVPVSNDNPKAFTWVFTKWTSEETPSRSWSENIDSGIRAKFENETVITANYNKSIFEQGTVVAEELVAYESTKGINNFIPTEESLKAQVKVIDADGNSTALPSEAKVELVVDSAYSDLNAELYDKLQEKDNANDEPTRIEYVKAKVTFKNGEVQEVEIPIKVIKNIYEAKTLTKRPYYVPEEYVRVVINPTSLATDPQKTYYYVNPKAKVVIPGEDPTGTGDNKFIKWTMKADNASGKGEDYTLSERHQFKEASTITAQYSADVVPQEGNTKPEGVPDNFVEVKFVPTDKAQDKNEKIFWVNPAVAVKIPVENPKGTQYYTFKEWKMGANADGAVYTPSTPTKFTQESTVITATYNESKNIIPYDPSETDPMARPKGYVRVTFAADEGLKLTEQKAYYVKKNAGITLGNAELAKPEYKEETGYKFDKWDKEDSLVIKDQDVLVTAKATALPDYDTAEHPGYKKVTFVADANGEIRENGSKVDEKVYYVNPNKFVMLPAPTPVGDTGYEFAAWSSDKTTGDFSLANYINYTEDTVITAMFNQKDAVYPKLKKDGSDKPAGYVEVNFVINSTNGKIADNEIKTYYVDPSREVSLTAPNTIAGTGYIFDGWRFEDNTTADKINPAEKRRYTKNTTFYGSFKELGDIIPATNDDGTPNLQPTDYVAVLFIEGEHAKKMEGNALFYVNPKADPKKTVGELRKPTIIPDTGWKHKGWDKADTTAIEDYMFVIAEYESISDVIEKIDENTKKPDGYVTVTFKSGEHGKLDGTNEKVYYVNPDKYVQLQAPNTVADNGYDFGAWKSDGKVFSLDNYIKYEKDTTIIAYFNSKGNVVPKKDDTVTKPDDFVTVNFVIDPSTGGKIADGQVNTYYVKKGEAVTIHPPKTEAETGYEFEKWDKDTTVPTTYADDVTTVKGSFTKLNDIIKSKEADGTVNDKPKGYVTVRYLKGDHGVLDGQTTFYVNPKAGKTLKNIKPDITIVPMPTYYFDKWDIDDSTIIDNDIDVTAQYKQLPDIIKAGPTQTAPTGYVVIIFETDGRGTIKGNPKYEDNPVDETEIVYFVNPKKGIKLAELEDGVEPSDTQLAVPSTTPSGNNKFDQWRMPIDAENPIIRGRVHIAMFKPKQVTLNYDKNGADVTGTVPPTITVDYKTSVRLAGKGDLVKENASFEGWKIGDNIYQAGDEITLTENAIAYAQWTTDKNIIPYDPQEPIARPDDTYVRVTFAVEKGLNLKEFKAYYVKKNAGITLGNAELAKPEYNEEIGYKFNKWDKEDTLQIGDADIVVTAKATKLDTVIPEKDEEGNLNTKPDGYKEVVFKVKAEDQSKGSLEGVTKFYVNPNEYVTINPPTTKSYTGYEFGAWDKDATIPTVYKDEVTTITASFNQIKDVIPKTKGDDSEKPAGYKTVTFVIEGEGGKIVDGETITYFVDPNRQVTIQPPTTNADTGYKFNAWDKNTTIPTSYAVDTTVKGTFSKLEDIIPATDDNPKPDGYVTVTFDKGEHGTKIDGQRVYYVNPKANITLGDKNIVKPIVSPETGWKTNGWDKEDTQPITGDLTVTAQYTPIYDVIPKTKDDESEKPDGYITVSFSAEENGKLTGQAVYYVNPNKAVVLKDKAPEVTPNTGFDFAGWDTSIDKAIQYKDKDVIKAKYNAKGDVIPQGNPDGSDKPAGYLKVTFLDGGHGTLTGQTVYYVKPNVEVTVPAPSVKANIGYNFKDWDKSLTQTFIKDETITAEYTPKDDIIPQKNTDGSDKPEGYHTVTFKSVNGSLEGTTTYYVKPNVEVDLTNVANAIGKKADVGYTAEGGTWDKPLTATFTQDAEYTFNFAKLNDVIPKTKDDESEQPTGYVKVTLIPTDKATDAKNIVYYVNPKAKVTIENTPMGKEISDANGNSYSYKFIGWTVTRGTIDSWNGGNINGKFIQDTEITAKYEIEWLNIINEPVPKDDVVTGKDDVPNAEDLIKNIPGTKDKPLPDGTKFEYAKKPDLSNPGKTTVEVLVTYPSGATTVVEVPITVVDNVVPQIGTEKPLVPDKYVKVTVDTTDKATLNTKFVKVFWVKPGVEVTLPDILAPTGRTVTDLTTKVTNTNNFIKWQLVGSDPPKFYKSEITDTFVEDSRIVAIYEFNDNIKPQPNNGQLLPKGSDPKAKDFIKNPYNDGDPKNKDNLPPGTSFEFVPGTEPDTSEHGEGKTTIKVTYPNGEVRYVDVTYNVTEDVVEQTDPTKKPDVPDNFVEVVVDTTDFAKGNSYYVKTYWVNPEKTVEIPASIPEEIKEGYAFDYWQVDLGNENGTRYRQKIEDRFVRPTYIKACYYKIEVPKPGSDYVVTDVNVFPTEDEYRNKITPPFGKQIERIRIIKQPDVSKAGNRTHAEVEVFYTDGTSSIVTVPVYVQKPGETNTRIIYRDRIVEKEKIVEKIVKIKDNQRLKEVRFMQGFEGKFRPHDGLTRAEAAQILANALKQDGYNYNPAYPINYKDVKQKWYTEAIVITTQANVFKGYDDGYFRPEEKISRAEWIATLKRFQQLKDADGNRMGLKENHWATREVEAAYEEGWLQIYTNGNAKFDANEPITREEVAAVSNRAFGRLVDKTYILRNDKSVINYKDINPSMWSYADILCASNSFIRDENFYMSHGIEYINSIVSSIDGNIIFNVELKNFEILQDKFQRYLR